MKLLKNPRFHLGKFGVLVAVATSLLGASASSMSQAWPSRSITIVSPYSAGGITDTLARIVADQLSKNLGQTVVVQNQVGAGGHIAGLGVARANPDGYTLLMAAGAMIVASPNTQPDIVKYDTIKDLAPIGLVGELPVMLVANPSIPAKDMKDFIAYAKEHSDKINCASTGIGTGGHLACIQLSQFIGKDLTHIPYKGAPDANSDLLANRVQIYFGVAPTEMEFVQVGKLRALGVATEERLPTALNIPTLREAGFPIAIPAWNALFAPTGTPKPILDRLSSELQAILGDASVQKKLDEARVVTRKASGPDDLRKLINQDFAVFKKLAVEAGLRKN